MWRMRTLSPLRGATYPFIATLVCLAVLSVTWNGFKGPGALAPADVLFAAALVLLLVHVIAGEEPLPLPGWLVGAALGLLAGALLAALFFHGPQPEPLAQGPFAPLVTPYEDSNPIGLLKFEMALFFVPVLIGVVTATVARAILVADLFVASAVLCSLVAVGDLVSGAHVGRDITGAVYVGREAGLAIHPNHLGLIGAMTLPVAIARLAVSQGAARLFFAAAALTLIGGVLASGSRIGLAAVALALALSALLIAEVRSKLAIAGLAVLIAAGVAAWLLPLNSPLLIGFDRLGGVGEAGVATGLREDQLRASLHIALDHPLTGVGFANVADAHSLPIQLVESGGIVALVAFLVFAVGAIATGVRLRSDRRLPPEGAVLAGGLTASVAVWLCSGLLQNPISDRYLYVPVGILLGLGLAASARGSLLDGGAARGVSRAEEEPDPGAGDVFVDSLARPLP
jgi:hypothetical protein